MPSPLLPLPRRDDGSLFIRSIGVVRRVAAGTDHRSGSGAACLDRLRRGFSERLADDIACGSKNSDSRSARPFGRGRDLKKTVYGSVDDLEEVSAALAEAKDDSSLHLFAEPPAGKRYPDRYDTRLLRGYYQRDKLTVLTARGESSRNDLDHVICDQLAMIGCDTVPGTEQGDSDTDLPEKFNGLDEKDRSEFHEKSAALLDAYRAIVEDWLSRIESLLPSAKNGFASRPSSIRSGSGRSIQTWNTSRDIVQERLVIARETLEQSSGSDRLLTTKMHAWHADRRSSIRSFRAIMERARAWPPPRHKRLAHFFVFPSRARRFCRSSLCGLFSVPVDHRILHRAGFGTISQNRGFRDLDKTLGAREIMIELRQRSGSSRSGRESSVGRREKARQEGGL